MKQMKRAMAIGLIGGFLAVAALAPTAAWSQTPDPLQQVEKRLTDKQMAAEAHRKQMESLKDPNQLSIEMRKHFQMTEEILALMLERRKLMQAQAPTGGTPSGMPSSPSGSGTPGSGSGMPGGGMMEHGMGMMQRGMEEGGMKPPEMGSMSGGGMSGSGMSGSQGKSGMASGDMPQMMQRITEHSAYMETLQDQTVLAQEMLRHQKMLDQMLQLMQQ